MYYKQLKSIVNHCCQCEQYAKYLENTKNPNVDKMDNLGFLREQCRDCIGRNGSEKGIYKADIVINAVGFVNAVPQLKNFVNNKNVGKKPTYKKLYGEAICNMSKTVDEKGNPIKPVPVRTIAKTLGISPTIVQKIKKEMKSEKSD